VIINCGTLLLRDVQEPNFSFFLIPSPKNVDGDIGHRLREERRFDDFFRKNNNIWGEFLIWFDFN
jgi:hypothetical protein